MEIRSWFKNQKYNTLGIVLIMVVTAGLYLVHSNQFLDTFSSNQGAGLVSDNSGALKPPLHGLISMGDISFRNTDSIPNNSLADIYARPGIFGGVVVNVTWSQLEPTQGVLDSTAIDQALTDVRTYNAKYPNTPLGIRLRVASGNDAPAWAKSLGGPPISDTHRGTPITIGRFWSDPYRQAWAQLQNMLANKYDSEPLILEVADSSCSSQTDEPFIIALDSIDLKNLHAAGFSDAAYKNCLMSSFNDYQGWKTTRVEFPFNPFHLTDSLPVGIDDAFTYQVMEAFRTQLGAHAVIGNHSLQSPVSTQLQPIYTDFSKFGPLIELQLNSPNKDSVDASIKEGVSVGATAIEVWDSSCRNCAFTVFSAATLQSWADEIKQNKI